MQTLLVPREMGGRAHDSPPPLTPEGCADPSRGGKSSASHSTRFGSGWITGRALFAACLLLPDRPSGSLSSYGSIHPDASDGGRGIDGAEPLSDGALAPAEGR